jgi:thioredoxin 1
MTRNFRNTPAWVWVLVIAALAVGVYLVRPAAQSGTDADTQAEADGTLPRLVDLGADKCVPCKMMAPILEELKTEFAGKFTIDFIDVWKNPEASTEYGIKLIPTQVF